MRYTDTDLLKLVGEERARSIGFGEGSNGELLSAREKALAYAKGEMADVPSLPNRSSVVDSSVADAIETAMPDLMEVIVGGDDVITFTPLSEDDEDQAKVEGDYVQYVVFTENEGFLAVYTAIKDALLTRTGILHWWVEEKVERKSKGELTASVADTAPMVQEVARQNGINLESEKQGDGSVNLLQLIRKLKVKAKAFPSEDFTVAADTVSLRDTTYCAVRDRPRVQDLIARGVDPELARGLPSYFSRDGVIERERDRAGESQQTHDDASSDLRVVEVRAHNIRLLNDEDELEIWEIVTDSEEKVVLHKGQKTHIQFAALTPYIVPHRLYGESVADKLMEIQRIKTALLRSHLDSVYYGLNQRMEVAEQGSNEFTISDLLRNEPGVPIRVKIAGTVTPVSAGALNVDTLASLEYASTMAESRSGIVRNAQGLNPDTLHDTMGGAMVLMNAAEKRTRMMARIICETGLKDFLVGIHCLLRDSYTEEHEQPQAKLRKKWTTVEPQSWPERTAVVGIGSSGREHDIMVARERLQIMQPLVELQGGLNGPLISGDNVHNALTSWEKASGSKTPELYWSDPANAQPQPPKPDPAMIKVQGEQQMAQAKATSEAQLAQSKAQTDAALTAQKHQNDLQASASKAQQDHELNLARVQSDAQANRYKTDQELQLKRETNAAELQLKRELLTAELDMKRQEIVLNAQMKQQTSAGGVSEVEPGGQPG